MKIHISDDQRTRNQAIAVIAIDILSQIARNELTEEQGRVEFQKRTTNLDTQVSTQDTAPMEEKK